MDYWDIARYIEIYRSPSEFPHRRWGQSHYIFTLKNRSTGELSYLRVFISKALIRHSWFDWSRDSTRLLTHHPLFPQILEHIKIRVGDPNNADIIDVYYSYFRYSKPFNFFWQAIRRLRHEYYKLQNK